MITIDEIHLKRGNKANITPALVKKGEPLIAVDTQELFVGTETTPSIDKIKISDVLFYNNFSDLPTTGLINKVYVIFNEKALYYWDSVNSAYIGGCFFTVNESTPPTEPNPGSNWQDPSTGNTYFWDELRQKWLLPSVPYNFCRFNNADNVYMKTGGSRSPLYYYIPDAATITSIYMRIESGNNTKGFSIRNDTVEIDSFALDSADIYINSVANIDLAAGTLLKIFVAGAGSAVVNPTCQLDIAKRST